MTTREKMAVIGLVSGSLGLLTAAIIYYDAHHEAKAKREAEKQ